MAQLSAEYVFALLLGATPNRRLRSCMNRFPGGGDARVRAAAALTAIAGWESRYNSDAVGDGGDSLGLWQIHIPTWKSKLGGAKRARKLAAGDDAQQLEALATVFCAKLSKLKRASELGWPMMNELAAIHLSIAWQYGGAEYARWIQNVPVTRNAAASFRRFREARDRGVESDFDQRQRAIADTYSELMESAPEPDPGALETAFDYWWDRIRPTTPRARGWWVIGGAAAAALTAAALWWRSR